MDFEKVKSAAGDVAQKTVKKSKEVFEFTKLNYQIFDLENETRGCYRELGKLVYEGFNSGEEFTEEIKEKCELITRKREEINRVKLDLAMLKNEKTCPNCAETVKSTAVYCSKCGAEF